MSGQPGGYDEMVRRATEALMQVDDRRETVQDYWAEGARAALDAAGVPELNGALAAALAEVERLRAGAPVVEPSATDKAAMVDQMVQRVTAADSAEVARLKARIAELQADVEVTDEAVQAAVDAVLDLRYDDHPFATHRHHDAQGDNLGGFDFRCPLCRAVATRPDVAGPARERVLRAALEAAVPVILAEAVAGKQAERLEVAPEGPGGAAGDSGHPPAGCACPTLGHIPGWCRYAQVET